MVEFGSLGGSRERKGEPSKTLVLLRKTMVFEVRRPRGRPQMQNKTCPETDPKKRSENDAFFLDVGSQNGAKMVPKIIKKCNRKLT